MEIKKLHCLIIAIVAIVSFSLVSCENENIDTPASVSEVNELNATQSDEGLVQTRSSDCSYPGKKKKLPGVNNRLILNVGNYAKRIKLPGMASKNMVITLIDGGPIITRSVYGYSNWYGSEKYTLYEDCKEMENLDTRSFKTYGKADSENYDCIYYEVIVLGKATIAINAGSGN